ncbi:PTCB-BRCT domain protein [Ceratobasidium sp. AG-Ba]|nr:PTCB-BRCT domain protein [Ceratobasidium sp. AG-Ba]
MSQEELKRILVNADSQFYLIPAKNPLDTYKVLWFRTSSDARVKVDLLQPGIMSIPSFSPSEIEYKSTQATTYSSTRARIPVAPFGLVLLLKLQAWEQHKDSSEYRFREKQHTDSRDIDVLLPLAAASNANFDSLPEEFLQEAHRRVILYTRTFPSSDEGWKRLGFKTFKAQVAPKGSIPRTSTSVNSPATRVYGRTSSLLTGEDELSRLLDRMRVSSATRPVARDSDWYD